MVNLPQMTRGLPLYRKASCKYGKVRSSGSGVKCRKTTHYCRPRKCKYKRRKQPYCYKGKMTYCRKKPKKMTKEAIAARKYYKANSERILANARKRRAAKCRIVAIRG